MSLLTETRLWHQIIIIRNLFCLRDDFVPTQKRRRGSLQMETEDGHRHYTPFSKTTYVFIKTSATCWELIKIRNKTWTLYTVDTYIKMLAHIIYSLFCYVSNL